MVTIMATVSLTPQQYQQLIDRISGLEIRITTLQTHAESQQEEIRVSEMVNQQLRTAGTTQTTSPSQSGAASLKPVTEGGAFKALTKYSGNHSEYHDWSFHARRVVTGVTERFAGLLQWISGQVNEINENDVLEYQRTTDLSTIVMDWLNADLCELLAIKTSDTALASIESLEEVEVKGIIG